MFGRHPAGGFRSKVLNGFDTFFEAVQGADLYQDPTSQVTTCDCLQSLHVGDLLVLGAGIASIPRTRRPLPAFERLGGSHVQVQQSTGADHTGGDPRRIVEIWIFVCFRGTGRVDDSHPCDLTGGDTLPNML